MMQTPDEVAMAAEERLSLHTITLARRVAPGVLRSEEVHRVGALSWTPNASAYYDHPPSVDLGKQHLLVVLRDAERYVIARGERRGHGHVHIYLADQQEDIEHCLRITACC